MNSLLSESVGYDFEFSRVHCPLTDTDFGNLRLFQQQGSGAQPTWGSIHTRRAIVTSKHITHASLTVVFSRDVWYSDHSVSKQCERIEQIEGVMPKYADMSSSLPLNPPFPDHVLKYCSC